MFSERDIELAHPDAFDFVWGNLPAAKRAEFNRHLGGCRYCQAIVDEYSEIGRIIKDLPPPVEPSADLEPRTIAAMVAALAEQRATTDRRSDAEDQAATRVYPIPEVHHPAELDAQVQPQPQIQPRAEDDTGLRPSPAYQPVPAEPHARPMITRLPVWRRYPRRLAVIIAAVAAIITAAVIVPLSLGGGLPAGAFTFNLVPPPGSGQAASGTAVARRRGPQHLPDNADQAPAAKQRRCYPGPGRSQRKRKESQAVTNGALRGQQRPSLDTTMDR